MEFIDVIFYINLENRQDRKEHFLKEIEPFCSDTSKIIRIDAVPNKIGLVGCVLSHIKAIETFEANPDWKTCIIFEDDFTFRNDIEKTNSLLNTFFKHNFKWDVFLLAFYLGKGFATDVEKVYKVTSAQTTSGYCLQKTFAATLKQNFIESSKKIQEGGAHETYALDQYWKTIQPQNNWYTIIPALGYQYACYSDIEKRDVNYGV
jgi:GR25 family glycosyltransferase involved in LPS biosynthesis